MPKYAVKIGEIQIKSDRPITEAERERVVKLLRQRDGETLLGTAEVTAVVVLNDN